MKVIWIVLASLPLVSTAAEPADRVLAERIDAALAIGRRAAPVVGEASPAEVMHWIIAFGRDAEMPSAGGPPVNAVTYLCERMKWEGAPAFATAPGGVNARRTEGHPNQFLAKLGRAGVPATQPIRVGDRSYTVADLLNAAKLSVTTEGEVSWTLLGMSVYLPMDANWTNSAGRPFDLPTLLEAELRSDPAKAACGGCHGLHAVSFALQRARAAGIPIAGVWAKAAEREAEYKRLARQGQNPDGSFSESYFGKPAAPRDYRYLVYSTGHVLEWLMYSMTDEEVRQPWVARAADRLARCVIDSADQPAGKMSYYHALHALNLYRERVAAAAGR